MGILLTAILLFLGTLMFLEGSTTIFFPKYTLKILKRFNKSTEKHFRIWGVGEIIATIILIVLALVL